MLHDNRRYRDFDASLLGIVFILFLVGAMTIHSATQAKHLSLSDSYLLRQLNWLAAGLALLFIAVKVSYQKFVDFSYLLYGLNVALLVMVLAIGHARLGAQRWFTIGQFAFQPSEFMKISFILALAHYCGTRKGSMAELKSLFVPCLLLGLPFVLVLLQPDLGTALLLVPVFFAMLLVGGAKVRHIVTMIIIGIACMPIFWNFLRDYQKQRLLVFMNPNVDPLGAGYTIIQSKIAVGSGGLWGKGWLAGTQNQLNFLPERHTDFIFSVIGEEWGFLGAAALVLLYYLVVQKAFTIADLTSDRYGKLIATGIGVLIGLQVAINISMTMGMMPVVGIPLPFVSYGGSSLLASLVAIGLLLNVFMRRSTF